MVSWSQGLFRVAAERAVQFGGAAFDQQVARQVPIGADAARNAGFHGIPNHVQTRIQLGVAAPGVFIGAHDLGDAHAGFGGDRQQFVAAMKRVL